MPLSIRSIIDLYHIIQVWETIIVKQNITQFPSIIVTQYESLNPFKLSSENNKFK